MTTLLEWDAAVFRFINRDLASTWLDGPMLILSSEVFWGVACAVLLAVFLYLRNRRLLVMFLLMALASGATDLFTYRILKPAIDRQRPCYQLEDVRVVPPSCGGTWSFPSNHAANGMASATVAVLYLRRRAAWMLVPLVTLVGVSRIYLGVHFPGDVIAGFVVGMGIGALVFGFGYLGPRALLSRRTGKLTLERLKGRNFARATA